MRQTKVKRWTRAEKRREFVAGVSRYMGKPYVPIAWVVAFICARDDKPDQPGGAG